MLNGWQLEGDILSMYHDIKGFIVYEAKNDFDIALELLKQAGLLSITNSRTRQILCEHGATPQRGSVDTNNITIRFHYGCYRGLGNLLKQILKGSTSSNLRINCNALSEMEHIINGRRILFFKTRDEQLRFLELDSLAGLVTEIDLEFALVKAREEWVSEGIIRPGH